MNKIIKFTLPVYITLYIVSGISLFSCSDNDDSADKQALISAIAEATELINNTVEASEEGAIAPGSKAELQKQIDWANYILSNSYEDEAFGNAVKELQEAMETMKNNTVKAAIPYFKKGSYFYAGTVGELINLNQFTIECRVRLEDLLADESSNLGNFITADKGNSIIFRYSTTGAIHAYIYANGWFGAVTADNVLTPGEWYNLGYTFDGETIRIYVNGNEVAKASGSPMVAEIDEDAPFHIGAPYETVNRSMHGNIMEVRFWNIARSESDMKTSMDSPLAGNEAGLTAYWPFDLNLGTEITDKTGNRVAKANGVIWQEIETAP